ncbi:hypothetical protein V6N13_034819 [Hibiscus sabdariffa]
MGVDLESISEATSGAIGSLLSTTILYPLDTCKTKYQAEVQAHGQRKYRNLSDVLWEAVSNRQVLSLYQGLGTKNLQSFIAQFVYFYGYSYFKRLYLEKSGFKSIGTKSNLILAAAAGACTAIVTQPLDTAASRMQTSAFGKSKGLWKTLTEGTLSDAFDGLGISLLLTSNPAIQYTVFDQLKQRLLEQKSKKADHGSSPVVLSAFTAFLLGAISKSIATIITYPAIRCKVMIQAAEPDDDKIKRPRPKSGKTVPGIVSVIWKSEGILGFFKGLDAQITKTVLSSALLLMIKEKITATTWVLILAIRRDNSFEIDPPSEVFNEGVSNWKLSLVGQFIGAAPNFVALRRIVASLWGKDALTKHKPLILRKWEPNLQRLDFDLTHMPVWVQLYNVPLELYSKLGLSYIASGLGVPLYMDSITASREKFEFAKVCVEVPAGVRLPRAIPVKMRDKSVVTVKVKVPWMPASCSSCKSFGHSEKLCSEVKAGNMQATEWRAKGVDGVGAVDGAANSVPNAAIAQLGGDVTEFNGDAIGSSAGVIEEFPPLQSPKVKGMGKGRSRGLKNRFEALQGVDPEEEVRKPRAASSGVMTLLQEMKAKKTEKVKAKIGSVDEGVRGCTVGQLGDLLQATIPTGVKEALVRTVTSAEIKAAIFGQGRFLTEKLKDEENKPQKTWKENPDSNGSEAGDFFATINREVPSCPDPLHNRIQDNYLRMIWIKDIDMVSETSKLSSDTKTMTTLYKITKQWTNEAHKALVLSRGEMERMVKKQVFLWPNS